MSLVKKVLRRFGGHNAIYDREYYETDVEGPASQAAPHIAASVVDRFSPQSLIDVGCGTGAMMEAFQKLGVSVLGLEYSKAGLEKCRARDLDVIKYNIERDEIPLHLRSDVVLSTEVAEHLPESVAPKYIELLCKLAPVAIFTAAQPGQGGTDHVNLQPKEYWMKLFAIHGRALDRSSTELLSRHWKANGAASFYHENLMVFATRD